MKIILLRYWKTIIFFLILYSITSHLLYLLRSSRSTNHMTATKLDSSSKQPDDVNIQLTKGKTSSQTEDDNSRSMVSMLANFQLTDMFSNLLPWIIKDAEFVFDVHLDDNLFGSAAEIAPASVGDKPSAEVIAIGGGITSRGVSKIDDSADFAREFQFFTTFLPTFCVTASSNFVYRFYLAFDHNDPVFANPKTVKKFQQTFMSETSKQCFSERGIRTSLHLVMCDHSGRPAWAQNDAMLEAYLDHVDYFYRINDDTR
jgi:hypothetical protein